MLLCQLIISEKLSVLDNQNFMNHPQPNFKMGITLMTGSGILFALMFVLIKSLSGRLSFMELGFFRSFLSLPFLLAYMFATRQSFRLKKRKLMFTRSLIGWLAMLDYGDTREPIEVEIREDGTGRWLWSSATTEVLKRPD